MEQQQISNSNLFFLSSSKLLRTNGQWLGKLHKTGHSRSWIGEKDSNNRYASLKMKHPSKQSSDLNLYVGQPQTRRPLQELEGIFKEVEGF